MHRTRLRWATVLLASTASGLAGCNNTQTVIESFGSDALVDVQTGSKAVAASAPSAGAVLEMAASAMVEACPGAFERGHGVTGSCSVGDEGERVVVFEGVAEVDGAELSVDGKLIVDDDEIDLAAEASGARGATRWNLDGRLTLNEAGDVEDAALALSVAVALPGEPTTAVSGRMETTRLELIVTGPRGGAVHFAMDRRAMAGIVTLDGARVAAIGVVNGCAVLDGLVPHLEDQVVCP